MELEEGLVDKLIDDVGSGEGSLPLQQFALTQLWGKQRPGLLTHQAYTEIGGVTQALANHAKAVYAGLSGEQQKRAQRVFIQLVQPGEGTEDTRRLATRHEVGDDWDLVTLFANERLLVTNRSELVGDTVEVVHEALIRNWGRLRGWMDDNREFRVWQERLKVALQQWVDSNKDDGGLLRGATLAVPEDWLQKRGEEISKPQRWFIEKSVELRERERKQKERLRRRVIGGLVCGLVVISGFAAVSEIRRNDAEIGRLSGSAEKYFGVNDQEAALVEAIKAGKILRGSIWKPWIAGETQMQAISTLREVVDKFQVRTLKVQGHTGLIVSVSYSGDGRTLASASFDGKIHLWNISTGKKIKTFKGHTDLISSVSYSGDGKTLASASWDNTVKLWNINSDKEIKTLKGHAGLISSVSYSGDGKTLASASWDNTVKLWNINSGKEIKTLKGHTENVNSVSFSPDGIILASASDDNTVKLWNINSGKEIKTLKGHIKRIGSVSFSPDGKTIASASVDNTVKLWNINSAKGIKTLTGYTARVNNISFSPDGKTLAVASDNNTVKLWDINSGKGVKKLKKHTKRVNHLSFSLDSKILASASLDDTVKLWNANTGREIKTLWGYKSLVRFSSTVGSKILFEAFSECSVSFSNDAKTFAVTSDDNMVKLWDVNSSRELKTLKGHTMFVRDITFSPDSKTLASASADRTVKLWDINSGKEIKTLEGHASNVNSVSFSPDGKTLASASGDKTIVLWNLDLDDLLVKGCRLIRGYLQNNPDVSTEDRHLCDNIKR